MILTPFLVLRPFVRDAWKVALHRSLGTLAGVLLVMVLAVLLPKGLPLQLPAIAAGVITAMIAIRRGHPAVMLMALTVTIVLLNSNHADLMLMADRRLQACGIGKAGKGGRGIGKRQFEREEFAQQKQGRAKI